LAKANETSSEPIKIGVIGAGFIGQLAHLDNYAMVDSCRIVALAELRPQLRKKVCQRYEIPKSYATHQEMLQDPEVEAVVAVTTRPMIGPIALDCLQAGKHLITEKPMAGTLEQGEKLVEAARSRGVHYAVGYMRRHDEGVQRAKELLDGLIGSGELGPINYVRAHCFQGDTYCNVDGHVVTDEKVPDNRPEWSIAPDWIPQCKQPDYAWFLNNYCHNINLIRYLLGCTPTVDFARLDHRQGRVVVFDCGDYLAMLEAGEFTSRPRDEVVEIYFEYGKLRIELPPNLLRNVPARVELYKAGETQEIFTPQIGWTWAFRRQAQAFIDDIRNDCDPIASGHDALEDMRLIEEIWRSELGRC